MSRLVLWLGLLLAFPAAAQTVNDYMVQAPELSAPQRGSLVGQYASTAFGPADVSRGGFSLASPFSVPTERGPLLASIFPTYSPDSGISEWGLGWQSTLALVRSRIIGDLDYSTDELTGPWGRLVKGLDGYWYPQGLAGHIRVEPVADGFIAYHPDGSRWTFGGTDRFQTPSGTYAWYLTEVTSATGFKTRLVYTPNTSGRRFLQSVSYGGTGEDFQYRVDFVYETLARPFVDLRPGVVSQLDRRVKGVEVRAKNALTGTFDLRWNHELGYQQEGLGPTFLLASVQQVFASGERAPAGTYEYELAEPTLTAAALRAIPRFDTVLTDFASAIIMPTRSTPLDHETDGWMDLEERTEFKLIHQQEAGFTYEALPPAPPNARLECRSAPSTSNLPRTLARMRADVATHQVVRLLQMGTGQTNLLLCERDGSPVHETTLSGTWSLDAGTRLADLNRDRQPDLLRVYKGGYWVIPNQSTNAGYAFGAQLTGTLTMGFTPTTVWVQDFNGDNLPDLIFRYVSALVVYRGRGNYLFEPEGQTFRAYGLTGSTIDLSRFQVNFADANRDGLTDVIINNSTRAFLLVNVGDRLVEKTVPGLNPTGLDSAFPIVQDFSGTGNTEVFFSKGGKAHSVALNTAGTGLLKVADDGKGTRLHFMYRRGPSASGQGARQSVLEQLTVESSGQDAVTYSYSYEGARAHSVGGFPLGYETVARTDLKTTHQMHFLHEDRFTGVPLSSLRTDANAPQVGAFETWKYQDATFQGVAWKRPCSQERGWQNADGSQRTSERTEYLEYKAEVCPSLVRFTTEHGTLVTEHTRSTLPGWDKHLHCLDDGLVMTGSHQDPNLDFRNEGRIERNAAGQVEVVRSIIPGQTLTLQQVTYHPDSTLATITIPGRGVMTFDYDLGRRMLRQVTSPEGVVTRVTERDPVTDAIRTLEMDRGALLYQQFFRYDAQERLAKQWDNLGGSEANPKETYSYRYATATRPGSVFVSQLVDAQFGAARDFIDYSTAAGGAVTTARHIPEGWVFDGVQERLASRAESRTWLRSGVSAAVDVLSMDYTALLAGAWRISSGTTGFGETVSSSTTFHDTVERQVATSLGLEAGQLTRTAVENGTWRTWQALDASMRLVAFEDQERTRTGYSYDVLGRLRQVDLPDGKTHRVVYDGHGRVSLLQRQGVASVEYVYAPTTGLLSLKRYASPADAVLRQVAFGYDSVGRIATETHSDSSGSPAQVYRYYRDGATPSQPELKTARGLVTAIEGEGYLKLFEYRADTSLERSILQLTGWRTVETQLAYTDSGEVKSEMTSVLAADGSLLSTTTKGWRWDTYGRLSELWLNGVPVALFGYDANGQPSTASFPGGQVTLGYDPVTRQRVSLTQLGPDWGSSTGLRLNARGLVDVETLTVGGKNLTREHGYSPQTFLTSTTDEENAYAYGFDGMGLPTFIEEGGVRRDVVTTGNILTAGGVTYTFDDLGRTITKGDLTLHYGPNGHLAEASRGSAQWSFLYDETGQRLLKRAAGVPVAAYLDQGLYLDTNGLTQPFRFGGQLVGVLRNGTLRLVATDMRGTVIADEDGTARLVSPFGDRAVHPDLSAALDYVQKGYDADLGLIRMGVRDYDPKLNRFLTPDPLYLEEPWRCVDSPVECNLYGYARSNPLRYGDPSGQDAEDFFKGLSMGTTAALLPAGSLLPVPPDQHEDFYVGYASALFAGGVIEGVKSVQMLVSGGGLIIGGGGASATGGGALVGVPAIAAGGVLVVTGTAVGIDAVADVRKGFEVLQMANQSRSGGGGSSASGGGGMSPGAAAAAKGAAREQRVADLVGGRVSRDPIRTRYGSSDIDVIGPNGELIAVGGPAKAGKNGDLSKLGTQLKILMEAARERGVAALAYFEKGTPQAAIDFAKSKLGAGNVFVFDP
ncbi:RHS repeat-associated core domain-containing protein [Archangium violaceum]|uniref:RHS repeat-associated core domain-containing protein n=1 Tax=Archangium violaceum TaxID=83451 RepID=UPI0036DB9180